MNLYYATSTERSITRSRPLLGTFVEVTVQGHARRAADDVIARAFAAITRVHELMSPRIPASDVARLNSAAVGRILRIHPWTWQVLRLARELSGASGGMFDVTAHTGIGNGSWRDVELPGWCRVRRRCRVMVDLGGIAKGFAVDRAIDALRRAGVSHAIVNAGGDLRVIGPHAEPVFVRDPSEPAAVRPLVRLADGAVATSGTYLDRCGHARIRRPDGRRLWLGRGSVSVCAPECVHADALTKIVAAIGLRRASPMLHAYHAQALVLTRRGRTFSSAQPNREVRHAA